ncbi:MAG: orotate phosphoribosyltransferase [Thiomonas sp. 20-64-9]|jgi:orotate phosphoribosyltransferase|uniref:orotate phosphoribosyltransferase n=1 Tax=unclassified Thiomonas TaxID=2625466 RepID=UPI000AA87BA6|nr:MULTISPECIES: orotate phosphoribosyltransferase [unclassified Thiomonas]OYV30139.1 MAG: orotate phosphoribosyltransferase [Thiomonas sp. 20-64-9]OZB69267.1 MAG: orotate phosphoribosyltransferase [Thiomonas sp. 13-64-67]
MSSPSPATASAPSALPNALDFIRFAVDSGVIAFGDFTTKAGRQSPYFFNAGLFNDGAMLARLAQFYARALLESGVTFDMLFGPAYKGIPLGAVVAVELARLGRNVGFAYNRKEAKDHGEGGSTVGAPIRGRVVIVDDVISAGTATGESVRLIRAAGAEPAAVLIALDRQEKAAIQGRTLDVSAVQHVSHEYGLPVISIANLDSLLAYLADSGHQELARWRPAVQQYRDTYGV